MKTKFYVLMAAFLLAGICIVNADDDVLIRKIYPSTGEYADPGYSFPDATDATADASKGLFLSKEDVGELQPGNALKLFLYDRGENARICYVGGWNPGPHPYPGTAIHALPSGGGVQIKLYVTEDLIKAIENEDFRLYGQNMKINRIEVYRGKYGVPGELKNGKTIWTGYFWIDERAGKTLEVYKEA